MYFFLNVCYVSLFLFFIFFFFLMIRRPPRSTQGVSSAASDVYKRQVSTQSTWDKKTERKLEGKMQKKNSTLQESEFLAENTLIEVIPNFMGDKLKFISGDFGPFKPGRPVSVPLWLALYLRKRNQCNIVPPLWLSVESLRVKIEEEKENQGALTPMPSYYYAEIASLLFDQQLKFSQQMNRAGEDIKDNAEIKTLLEDIQELRSSKLTDKIKEIGISDPVKMHFANITSSELTGVRSTYIKAINTVYELNVMEAKLTPCLLYTSPSPRDLSTSRMPSSA
eukprot:TRINITY_DN2938_c0_g1_i1.p1 TRINITY_DN2938_c0_g1~~TRINITY_DN2938_c0_g1_i1.p1  ORF type:complete len:280 (-),score=67.95 TRINITY_DN2938_c0_g1_i1:125-964(-)